MRLYVSYDLPCSSFFELFLICMLCLYSEFHLLRHISFYFTTDLHTKLSMAYVILYSSFFHLLRPSWLTTVFFLYMASTLRDKLCVCSFWALLPFQSYFYLSSHRLVFLLLTSLYYAHPFFPLSGSSYILYFIYPLHFYNYTT